MIRRWKYHDKLGENREINPYETFENHISTDASGHWSLLPNVENRNDFKIAIRGESERGRGFKVITENHTIEINEDHIIAT